MISETVGLASLIILLLIFFVKLYNVFRIYSKKENPLFSIGWIFLLLILAFFCWSFYNISLVSMVVESGGTTITNGSSIYTITEINYVGLASYGATFNVLLFFVFLLTIAEVLLLMPQLLFSYIPRS